MNEDTIKGSLKKTAGKIQKEWGEATDDPKDIAAGSAKIVAGKAQKIAGEFVD